MSTGPPPIGTTGQEIYDNTVPARYAEEQTDYAWARFLDALSHLLDPVADVTRPPDGALRWTVLASPWRCPPQWLPVLAQWAGVRRWDLFVEDDLRTLLATGGPGFWRGTKAHMIASARRFYAPDAQEDPPLYFEERARISDDEAINAYWIRVFTYSFVQHDYEQVRRALLRSKPAGINLIYEIRDGQTYGQLKDCGYTYWQLNVGFADYQDVLRYLPPPCRDAPPTPHGQSWADLAQRDVTWGELAAETWRDLLAERIEEDGGEQP